MNSEMSPEHELPFTFEFEMELEPKPKPGNKREEENHTKGINLTDPASPSKLCLGGKINLK